MTFKHSKRKELKVMDEKKKYLDENGEEISEETLDEMSNGKGDDE